MRNRIIRVFALALLLTVLFSNLKIGPVRALISGNLRIVGGTGNYADLFSAITGSISNDQIHVSAGHTETWSIAPGLLISVPRLYISGSPLGTVAPVIDMNGWPIHISAPYVFIWGLNIINSGGIFLDTGSHDCMIWNNTIQTVAATGIKVQTPNNIIANNSMSYNGEIPGNFSQIVLYTEVSQNNIVKYNTLYPPYHYGITVSANANGNYVYWNNIMSTDPNSYALWDGNPHGATPIVNWFDDITAVSWTSHKGNYEANIPHGGVIFPYPVPGPGNNGNADNHPLTNQVSPLPGDINLDGQVGLADLVILARAWGQPFPPGVWPGTNLAAIPFPHEYDPRADVAPSGSPPTYGTIGLSDLVYIIHHWGSFDP